MIITLKGANFSANNIGTLSTWMISRSLGNGATYEGASYVDKDAALNATVTIAEGYELNGDVVVTMGGVAVTSGVTVEENVITIAIASVTGNVVIKVPTKNVNGDANESITMKTNEFLDMVGTTVDGYKLASDNTITLINSDTSKTSYRHVVVPVSQYEITHLCCVTASGSGNYNIIPLIFLSGDALVKENVISHKYGTEASVHSAFRILDEDIVIPEGCTHIAFGEFTTLTTVMSEDVVENRYKITYKNRGA